jgi:hypothetical protein
MEEHAGGSRGFHVSSVHNSIASIADGFTGELMVVPHGVLQLQAAWLECHWFLESAANASKTLQVNISYAAR